MSATTEALIRPTGSVRRILEKADAGERIGPDECLTLFREGDLLSVGAAADRRRRQLHPERVVSYIVDRNINYTNSCVADCKFCAFYRKPKSPQVYVLDRETLETKIQELVDAGGIQILLQGGHHPTLKLDWYEDLLRWIRSRWKVLIHGFSSPEIQHFAKINRLPVDEVIRRLRSAGLDTVPGGGAEILSDRVRFDLARNRCSTQEWLDVHRIAHEQGMRSTCTMVIGHLETLEERVEHLRLLRELQDGTGGFTAFIVWTMQTENTEISALPTAGGHEYLRTQAIARLFLDNVRNIQASWVTQGHEVGQLALRFGANDMGGTMMEENVVSQAGTIYHMDEPRIRELISKAGFLPKRRDTTYRFLE
jgi:cyclic dehypoxanthinyl futalosine synthase